MHPKQWRVFGSHPSTSKGTIKTTSNRGLNFPSHLRSPSQIKLTVGLNISGSIVARNRVSKIRDIHGVCFLDFGIGRGGFRLRGTTKRAGQIWPDFNGSYSHQNPKTLCFQSTSIFPSWTSSHTPLDVKHVSYCDVKPFRHVRNKGKVWIPRHSVTTICLPRHLLRSRHLYRG